MSDYEEIKLKSKEGIRDVVYAKGYTAIEWVEIDIAIDEGDAKIKKMASSLKSQMSEEQYRLYEAEKLEEYYRGIDLIRLEMQVQDKINIKKVVLEILNGPDKGATEGFQRIFRDLFCDLAKNDPEQVLKKYELIKNMPWVEDVFLIMADSRPDFTATFLPKLKNPKLAEKVAKTILESHIRAGRNYFFVNELNRPLIEKEPWGKEILAQAIMSLPSNTIIPETEMKELLDHLSHSPKVEAKLQKYFTNFPGEFLQYYGRIKTKPWAKKIFPSIFQKGIEDPFLQKIIVDNIQEFRQEPLLKTFMERHLEPSGEILINCYDKWKDANWSGEILEKIVSKSKLGSETILKFGLLYKNTAWGKKAIRDAVDKLKGEQSLVRFAKCFSNQPWAPEIIKLAHADDLLFNYDEFSDQPWADELIKPYIRVLLKNKEVAIYTLINKIYAIKDNSQKLEVVNYMLDNGKSVMLIHLFKLFKTEPWAGEIFQKAVTNVIQDAEFYSDGDFIRALEAYDDYKDQKGTEEFVKILFKNLADHSEIQVFDLFEKFRHFPWAKKLLYTGVENIAKTGSYQILEENRREFLKKEFPKEYVGILEKAAFSLAKNPNVAMIFEKYKNILSGYSWSNELFKQAAFQIMQANNRSLNNRDLNNFQTDFLKNKPWRLEFIQKAVIYRPLYVVEQYKTMQDIDSHREIYLEACKNLSTYDVLYAFEDLQDFNKQEMLEKAIEKNPFEWLKKNEKIPAVLEKSKNPILPVLDKIISKLDNLKNHTNKSNLCTMIDSIVKNKLSIDQALEIANDPAKFLQELLAIEKQDSHYAQDLVSTVLKQSILRTVREINDLHEASNSKRFESVNDADAYSIYTLITIGSEEVFTSTFNGLYTRMKSKMKSEGINGYELLAKNNMKRLRVFIRVASSYNKLADFFNTMTVDQKKDIIEKFSSDLEKSGDKLSEAITMAETLGFLKDPEVLKIFESKIRENYEATKDPEAKLLYGMVASIHGQDAINEQNWFKSMNERYPLLSLQKIPARDLYNEDGTHIQEHFFYDDSDGKASFRHFLNAYKADSGWKIIYKDSYVQIKSLYGKKVEIFANKPDHEDDGPEKIAEELEKRKVTTIAVFHRGHSYHAETTIEKIPKSAKIVSLGSCGGYNNLVEVLKKAPSAHVISTKGTGTMNVNDPVFKSLNNVIVQGKDIDWPIFWEKMKKNLGGNKDFEEYVAPHQNVGVIFVKKFFEEREKTK